VIRPSDDPRMIPMLYLFCQRDTPALPTVFADHWFGGTLCQMIEQIVSGRNLVNRFFMKSPRMRPRLMAIFTLNLRNSPPSSIQVAFDLVFCFTLCITRPLAMIPSRARNIRSSIPESPVGRADHAVQFCLALSQEGSQLLRVLVVAPGAIVQAVAMIL
jgi:hypothetical protein